MFNLYIFIIQCNTLSRAEREPVHHYHLVNIVIQTIGAQQLNKNRKELSCPVLRDNTICIVCEFKQRSKAMTTRGAEGRQGTLSLYLLLLFDFNYAQVLSFSHFISIIINQRDCVHKGWGGWWYKREAHFYNRRVVVHSLLSTADRLIDAQCQPGGIVTLESVISADSHVYMKFLHCWLYSNEV